MSYSIRRLRRSVCYITATLLCISAPIMSLAGAQVVDMSFYQSNTMVVLQNERHLIEPTLTPTALQIARSIHYRVTGSTGINALAGYEDGKRVIVIHAGTIQMIYWAYDALAMDQDLKHPGCLKEFMSYLLDSVNDNQSRLANGLGLSPVMSPALFAMQDTGACSGIQPNDFLTIQGYGNDQAKAIEASIMFLYLHELGHHVLGHVDEQKHDDAEGMAMSRAQEDAADRFAVATALAANYNLVAATPWYTFMAAFGGNSLESEQMMDHPLGIRRILSVFDETINFYQLHPKQTIGGLPYEEFMQSMRDQKDQLSQEINGIN